jgi:transposase
MNVEDFFLNPLSIPQKQYEALRSFYIDHMPAKEAAKKAGFSYSYFKKLCYQFRQNLKKGINPFFQDKKTGPKKRFTKPEMIDEIIALRKKNYSILDIKAVLESKNYSISADTIDNILKEEGFAPLQKRTRNEKISVEIPSIIEAAKSIPLEIINEEFTTEKGAGPLIFLPLIEELGIIEAIKKSLFPQTSVLNDVSMILSILALKILGNERLSHDKTWNFDRALGFSAGLNVLPKNGTISSYSYRVDRSSNKRFLLELCNIFKDTGIEEGEFNLDFKAIPHWGDESVL